MIRRDFIKLGVASLSAYPLAAAAQRPIPVIGALSPAARPTQFNSSIYAAFAVGMRELGYVEGKTIPSNGDLQTETTRASPNWRASSSG
jgi:hypothetical protein